MMWAVKFLLSMCMVSLLSGCGYQQLKREKFSVNTAWSAVMTAYNDLDSQVGWVTDVLQNSASPEHVKVAEKYIDARRRVVTLNAEGNVTVLPAMFMNMRQNLRDLNKATDTLIDVGSRVVGAGGPGISASQRERWAAALSGGIESAKGKIDFAKQHYGLTAQVYNEITKVFPNSVTAKVMGFEHLPDFESGIGRLGEAQSKSILESLGALKASASD